MRLNKKRFNFLKKRKRKAEGKRITYAVISKETGISIPSFDDYMRSKDGIQNPISFNSAKKLAKYFDCHPGYLVGTVNEKASEVHPLFKLTEAEFIKSMPRTVSHDEYLALRAEYDGLIDDDGYFIPPYRDYEYEEKRSLNIQDFQQWLLSINMFENPDFLEGFPSNAILKNVLSNMSYGEMQLFQGNIIDAVSEYLTVKGYIPDYGGYLADNSNITEEEAERQEEEANKRWIKKHREGFELYQEISEKEGK